MNKELTPGTVVTLLPEENPQKPVPGDIGEIQRIGDDGQVYVYWRRLERVEPVPVEQVLAHPGK